MQLLESKFHNNETAIIKQKEQNPALGAARQHYLLGPLRTSHSTEEYHIRNKTIHNTKTMRLNMIRESDSISTIQVINAPGTVITNLVLENTTIELINSPNSVISNNRIHDLKQDSNVSLISIFNSSNTVIIDNIIENSKSTKGTMTGILVNESTKVIISNNTISNLTSKIEDGKTSISLGILLSNSTFSNITQNHITNIFGGSTAAIVIEKGNNDRIGFNRISNITTFSTPRSESFAILLVENSNSVVHNNKIQNIYANNFQTRSFSFGISLTDVEFTSVMNNNISVVEAIADRPDSFGIHIASSNDVIVSENSIDNIFTKSNFEGRAFSTGIYISYSLNLKILSNDIEWIIVEGRASYGVYADYSNFIELSNNSIHKLYSVFRYQNNAEAIILRIVDNIIISNNFISEIESLTINQDINLQIPAAIAILLDNNINTTVESNIIEKVSSISNGVPTDSIGILISSNEHAKIQNNTITNMFSNKFDSYAIGITSHASVDLIIKLNIVENINSESNSIFLYQAFSREVSILNNSLNLTGDGEDINGIYSVKNYNETIENNNIVSNLMDTGISAIRLSFNENFNINNNQLIDLVNSSIGITIKTGKNGIIKENSFLNFLLWMEMTNDSNFVACDENNINDVIHRGCIIGQFHDLIKLGDDVKISFSDGLPENADLLSSTPNSRIRIEGSFLISLLILPVFFGASSSIYMKRKQIKAVIRKNKSNNF